ncbi:AMP-dependent synthetase/ligase [Thermomonospora cellulosilytica]|uniref:Acyl-CoA synthetase n=1 Tax=Thermomonospora cellulosilytica TaxID=1411118 RepID=A0A7W3N218_9ACTN|nr:AMP-dependent synthetase/ligase [Thermomonospora cellulosilytica]MBA9006095.1 long-chain acyl-CoA synthetase [Thermomonospora cellulosilytica]
MQAEILERRAEFERAIDGMTLCTRLRDTAERHPDLPAYSDRGADGEWITLTWGQTRRRALEAAAGFVALGLEPGEVVALMMPNRSEHVLADFGAVHAGGTPTTVYATLAPDQVAFVAGNCSAAYAVLDGRDQLDRWTPVLDRLPALRKVIVVDAAACPAGDRFITWDDFMALGRERLAADAAAIDRRWQAITPEDTLCVLYTSGTTGNPKGVLITHRMALYEAAVSEAVSELPPHNTAISYLPFAHIADRVLSMYLPVVRAAHIHFCPDPAQLTSVLGQVRPHSFFGVPRVWEKIMAGVQAVLGAETDEAKKAAVAAAMEAGRAYVRGREYGNTVTPEVQAAFDRADAAVLRPMRALLGLDRVEQALSAAAPLPIEVARFFAGLGIRIMDVYGMTETTGAVTANTDEAFRLGTVGRPFPGVELRLAEDGEILIRGTTCTPGYLNRPDATAELKDSDGWVHTGDVGELDADGFLKVVDRKKELLITAGGENIAPSLIENLLKEHPLVGQALAYGDRRPYVVALITLDGEVAPVWAAAAGIDTTDLAALAEHPVVLAEVGRAVEDANARLARVQQVKKWRLLPTEWTAESEELTPTLKLKRRVVHAKYADVIEQLYRS